MKSPFPSRRTRAFRIRGGIRAEPVVTGFVRGATFQGARASAFVTEDVAATRLSRPAEPDRAPHLPTTDLRTIGSAVRPARHRICVASDRRDWRVILQKMRGERRASTHQRSTDGQSKQHLPHLTSPFVGTDRGSHRMATVNSERTPAFLPKATGTDSLNPRHPQAP